MAMLRLKAYIATLLKQDYARYVSAKPAMAMNNGSHHLF